jgi:hypothetical protein
MTALVGQKSASRLRLEERDFLVGVRAGGVSNRGLNLLGREVRVCFQQILLRCTFTEFSPVG